MGTAIGVALPLRSTVYTTLARPLRTMDGVALALSTALHALSPQQPCACKLAEMTPTSGRKLRRTHGLLGKPART